MKSKKLSEKILRSIKSRGFNNITLDPVLETKYILQRSGENFKKFLFSFYDLNGKELCLRPDLTISSVIRFIQNKKDSREKVFYSGEAFRKTYQKKDSIIKNQIGYEILGSKNKQKDDKEIIDTSIKILKSSSFKKSVLKIGNVELFNLLIHKLDIPRRWKNRLKRYYWNENYFKELLKRLETNSDVDSTIVEIDKKRYQKMLKNKQENIVAGRSIAEILKRFNNKIKDPRRAIRGKKASKIIKDFLNINCPINKTAKKLNSFFKKNKINLIIDQKYFPISQNKLSKLNVEFSASFGRELEYYTGMVFKIDIKNKSKKINIINGGRFDKLIFDLGSKKQVPAVGAALNLNY